MYVWTNGNRYIGDFRDNQRTGRGTILFADGGRYEGEFVNGKMQGRGVRVWANGARYEGEWLDDQANGWGTKSGGLGGQVFTGTWTIGCFRENQRWATVGATRAGLRLPVAGGVMSASPGPDHDPVPRMGGGPAAPARGRARRLAEFLPAFSGLGRRARRRARASKRRRGRRAPGRAHRTRPRDARPRLTSAHRSCTSPPNCTTTPPIVTT